MRIFSGKGLPEYIWEELNSNLTQPIQHRNFYSQSKAFKIFLGAESLQHTRRFLRQIERLQKRLEDWKAKLVLNE